MEIRKKVVLDLTSINGNAYSLMANFRKQAQREKWTKEEIDFVLSEAKSGNYDHLLNTLASYCEEEMDNNDDNDNDEDENDCVDCLEEDCSMCK